MTDNNLHTASSSSFPPSDWVETTLGEVVEIKNEKLKMNNLTLDNYISTENLLPDRLGVQKSANLPNIPSVNAFKKNDTLFSNIRTYFKKVWFARFDGGASNDVLIFTPKDERKLDKKFLYYFISSDRFIDFTVISAKGTKMPRGDKEAIKTFSFSIPPLPEQQAIASVLSAFDDKIELLREENKTLEEMGQTIFQEWFGKYGVDDELPDGWRVGKLGEICSLKSGFAFSGDDFVEKSNTMVLKIKDLKGNGIIDLSDTSFVKDEIKNLERVQYFKLKVGDIVLAMSGNTTGKIGVIPNLEEELFLNQRVGKFFINDDKYKTFIYFFLMSGNYEEKILAMGYGSAQPNINPTQIEDIDIIYSDSETLENFINATIPIFTKILDNLHQIQSLARSRDELLPRLMSGMLRVNDFINN